jgi:hypothetical protein
MKRIIVIISIILLLLVLGFSGCLDSNNNGDNSTNEESTDEEKIIGTWINSDIFEGYQRNISYSFFSNKTCLFSISYRDDFYSTNGTWKIEDKKLIIIIEGQEVSGDYTFLDNDKKLAMIDESGNTMDFIKKI